MTATLLALCGVLLGGALSIFGQRINSDRVDDRARAEVLRQARLAAVSGFAAAAMAYRRAVITRKVLKLRSSNGEANDTSDLAPSGAGVLSEDVRRTRAGAWEAYYHLRLLAPNEALPEQARGVIDDVKEIREIENLDALDKAGDLVRVKIDQLIDAAKAHVL